MALIKKVEIDIGVKGDAASKAKLDGITAKAEELKKAFPEYALKIDSAAATERIKVFKDELRSIPNETTAKVKVKVDSSALNKLSKSGFLQPSALGSALALSPSLIPLAGGIAGAVGAIGISFGAATIGAGLFGLAAKSVLSQASSDAQKLSALNAKLATAQTAAQKKAVKQQIEALTIGWAKGYANLIGQYQDFHQKWKAASQAIAVPALTTWLGALTKGLPLLVTAVKPVANVFQAWGDILRQNFSNPAVMKNLQGMAAAFGRFSAGQLALVGGAIENFALGVFHLGKDLAGSGANFSAFGIWVNNMGAAFLTWSKSGKARADVQGFLHYLHTEGPVVGGILSSLGKILPGIFAGATTTGNLELQAIGGLLSLIAKLPKGWQAPLTEAAGAILLLSKTGVLKVGIKIVGVGAKIIQWMTGGGLVQIGAKAMQAAGDTMAAAAAAMQRAADTMVGADAGAAGAGGAAGKGAAAGGAAGLLARFGLPSLASLAGYAAGATAITGGLFLKIREDASKGLSAIGPDVVKALTGTTGFLQIAASGWSDTIVGRFEKPVRALFVRVEHNIANAFDIIRHAVSTRWDAIWSQSIAQVRSGISTVVGWFRGLPGRAVGALTGLGHSLGAFAAAALNEMWSGFKRIGGGIVSWFGNFGRSILNTVKKIWGILSPSSAFAKIGDSLMEGLAVGIKRSAGKAHRANTAAAKALGGFPKGGSTGPGAAAAQAWMRAHMGDYGWSAAQFAPLQALWNHESGWRWNAQNPTSPAYGIPQSDPGSKMAVAGADWRTNPVTQMRWGAEYIRATYGNPANAWAFETSHTPNWYDKGGWLMPGLTLAMNKTGRPERVLPPGASGTTHVVLQVRAPHGATDIERALVAMVQKFVTVQGGDVQSALGRT